MINVSKPYLPDKIKYKNYIDKIYTSGHITNNGPNVKLLTKRLEEFLNVKNIILTSNGTTALEIAYRTLEIEGHVITTPFSFIATLSSLVTNGIKPVFVDINPETLNINPENIEESITSDTVGIVPVHVFGNPCDVARIDEIARNHSLKVIYDAAHSFNVTHKGKSILDYGNISTLSFHATKIFHTIEGGALIINDNDLANKARALINFGIQNTGLIIEHGTNAKMNEFEAAMGLCMLDSMPELFRKVEIIYKLYKEELQELVILPKRNGDTISHSNFFPIILESEKQLKKVEKALNTEKISPKRYFYPSLESLPWIKQKKYCSIARDISSRILCLPFYVELERAHQMKIISIIKSNL